LELSNLMTNRLKNQLQLIKNRVSISLLLIDLKKLSGLFSAETLAMILNQLSQILNLGLMVPLKQVALKKKM
jgi:hypothetical protein